MGLVVAVSWVIGQVLGYCLVGVEAYLRKAAGVGLLFGLVQKQSADAAALSIGGDSDVFQQQMIVVTVASQSAIRLR
jgi:hypothetical protein